MTLPQLRDQLLDLHKALLEYQKHVYESTIGPVANPNQYYNLVLSDPSFAWLRELSALVVSIDELLESKEPITEEKTKQVATYTKGLLTATGKDTIFEQKYTQALQKDPHIALLHGNLLPHL
jgi:hypothetical protein